MNCFNKYSYHILYTQIHFDILKAAIKQLMRHNYEPTSRSLFIIIFINWTNRSAQLIPEQLHKKSKVPHANQYHNMCGS